MNKKILKILDKRDDKQELIKLLVGIYNNLDFDEGELSRKLYTLGIVNYDYSLKKFVWIIPLYEGDKPSLEKINYEKLIHDLFKSISPSRAGSINILKKRMNDCIKRGFSKEQIFNAAQNYINQLDNPKYLMYSYKFLWRSINGIKEYPFENYLIETSKNYDIQ